MPRARVGFICRWKHDATSLSGLKLVFTRNGNIIKSNGVFFHQKYMMTPLGEEGFRAYAENDDRTDIFRLEDGILFHSAIVKYGDEPSVQSQVFSCALQR